RSFFSDERCPGPGSNLCLVPGVSSTSEMCPAGRGAIMSESEPISTLVKRLHDGDPQAANLLFERYARRLARAAEQHLAQNLAGRLDGEDVVQPVSRPFSRRHAAGEFRLDSTAQLWRLLLQITLRKARFQARFHLAARRDAAAEANDDDFTLAQAVAH